jgi:uncharacterized protein (TIGR02996 family)
MPDERSDWLTLIRAQPDDDAPRLAFADWLDDHGEPDFARFIRLEIELDPLPKDRRRRALQEEAQGLRRKLPLDMRPKGYYMKTRRGFVDSVQGNPWNLRPALPTLGPYAPKLTVHLNGNAKRVGQAELTLARGGPDAVGEAIRELFTSSWVQSWTVLECHNLPLTEERLRSMIEPGHLLHLERLCLHDSADDGAIRVLGEAALPQLVTLELKQENQRMGWGRRSLTVQAVRFLIDTTLLEQIQTLSLVGEWLGDAELEALAASPRLASLKHLTLVRRREASKGLNTLLSSRHLANLERLNLAHPRIDDEDYPQIPEAITILADLQQLPGLRELEISFADTIYRDLLLPRFGDGLLVPPSDDSEERRVAHLRLPYHNCLIHVRGSLTKEDANNLDRRVTKAIAAALLEQDLGKGVKTAVVPDSSHEYLWNCWFQIFDIRQAIILLREVLGNLSVPPHTIIQVSNYADFYRTYPLTPSSTDWDDLAEVEHSTSIPDAMHS